jgi:acyl dehydratase
MKTFDGLDDLVEASGCDLGKTVWVEIDQTRIDAFADATGDHQWIHVDTTRAADGPFGATIAHGFLTLSMLPVLLNSLYRVTGVAMAINYGLNKVRFPHPVPSGARIRGNATIVGVDKLEGAVDLTFSTAIEIENVTKPACVVESVVRYVL